MTTNFDNIRDDFAFLDDWQERYRYIIDLGNSLLPYPEEARDEEHKVRGCASQVWLLSQATNEPDPRITLFGDSDAHIVRGLVALMLALYSGKKASEILAIDAKETLQSLGLDQHLSAQRSNGLHSMVQRIQSEAAAALA